MKKLLLLTLLISTSSFAQLECYTKDTSFALGSDFVEYFLIPQKAEMKEKGGSVEDICKNKDFNEMWASKFKGKETNIKEMKKYWKKSEKVRTDLIEFSRLDGDYVHDEEICDAIEVQKMDLLKDGWSPALIDAISKDVVFEQDPEKLCLKYLSLI